MAANIYRVQTAARTGQMQELLDVLDTINQAFARFTQIRAAMMAGEDLEALLRSGGWDPVGGERGVVAAPSPWWFSPAALVRGSGCVSRSSMRSRRSCASGVPSG